MYFDERAPSISGQTGHQFDYRMMHKASKVELDLVQRKLYSVTKIKLKIRSVAVRNSNHFVDELIEVGGFSRILKEKKQANL